MVLRHFFGLALLALTLSSCNTASKGPPAVGEAFVGPATLNLRQELAPKSPVVAVVKHGEKLEVIQTRRRFVRVRTTTGAMGWTDSRQLLSTAQMDDLRELAESAAKLPSQGTATVYEPLNIHTEPNRASPSFAQIPETASVQVVGHRLAPKVAPLAAAPMATAPKPVIKKKEKKADPKRLPPPPMPAPPPLPPNWLELSRSAIPRPGAEEEFAKESAGEVARQQAKEKDDPAEKPIPLEDWNLVRLKDGRTGWVLARLLTMAIPDEVAQYAEGHRITSYFVLADVQDGDQTKHYWLWTTMARGGQPYEFDGYRMFIWNSKRHRYETAYIEKNVEGYYPVEARKGTGERGEGATFSVIVRKDGETFKKTFSFNGYRVNLVKKDPYELPADSSGKPGAGASAAAVPVPATPAPAPGMLDQLKDRAKSILKR
jgi:hypothetical protein